ncbi:MAG: hypothetical protein A2W61_03700 [Deltaproteobacteria bacterium RIFCSPLOWO2_01_44_7]|nr:MAG: hypothetical protein A2712_06685 [Deltaproteobacteria bacterium RIFCSPHIGHO2_01_FULL_43_49]OGQ15639.1 MAG: hypothetical protein A3D22_05475 [Deltaproteobacteria bacterium RIFCSPHIGHO2_02_FULL_44_53]OGQ28608.1 MAG: hypothetical protein A3D98_00210 [Deltaproteobacteria bacterium RIFCSPHIGHO2_12_FULL_44_21]OGQ31930.1 MAG: hypothetical protein A2979_02415 [Deltaproteobacteria bacterium RIFCSPLOWO2_01_FULL_45_74]OGQ38472.1 MAG: hypothetical protein A2W61_03700 [Deltaproteobacteria bacterium 
MVNLWANSVVGLQLSAADLALNRAMEQVLTTTGYQVPGGTLPYSNRYPVVDEGSAEGLDEAALAWLKQDRIHRGANRFARLFADAPTTRYQVPGGMLAKGPVQTEKAPQGIEEPDAQGETGGILNLPFEGKTNGTKLIKGQNGTYEVLEELKGGGEARIYLGRNVETDQKVIIRRMRDAKDLKEVRKEALALKNIDNPYVVRFLDISIKESKDLWELPEISLIIEYVDGQSLAELIQPKDAPQSRKIFTEAEVIQLKDQMLSAIQAAHEKGILHRDIKLSNIMMTKAGDAKLTDFGIAKILTEETRGSSLGAGSVYYMSPEQLDGKSASKATDIYQAGLVLINVMLGKEREASVNTPFHRPKDQIEELRKQGHFNEELLGFVSKITADDPKTRLDAMNDWGRPTQAIEVATTQVISTGVYLSASEVLSELLRVGDQDLALMPYDIFSVFYHGAGVISLPIGAKFCYDLFPSGPGSLSMSWAITGVFAIAFVVAGVATSWAYGEYKEIGSALKTVWYWIKKSPTTYISQLKWGKDRPRAVFHDGKIKKPGFFGKRLDPVDDVDDLQKPHEGYVLLNGVQFDTARIVPIGFPDAYKIQLKGTLNGKPIRVMWHASEKATGLELQGILSEFREKKVFHVIGKVQSDGTIELVSWAPAVIKEKPAVRRGPKVLRKWDGWDG